MSDRSNTPDQPALDVLASTDRFLDALGAREPVDCTDSDGDALAGLLEEWRDELSRPSEPSLSEERAVAALDSALAGRRRRRRLMTVTTSVAAAVLAFGGFGVMVGDAQPGDALYDLHTLVFGEAPSVHDDQIELAAKTELAEVEQMIAAGQWDKAQDRLAAVNDTVQNVNDTNRKQNLIDQVNQLNAKLSTHDPNATGTPGSSAQPSGPAG